MTTLSKSVKVKNAVSATYLLLFYNTKNRLHFSSQYTEFSAECDGSVWEIPTYTQEHLSITVCFLAVSENNRST